MDTPIKKMRLTDRKRQDILAAAVSEFQEHGYEKTSMDHIAKIALVSKRTVYNHFASKEALFLAMVDKLLDQIQDLSMPFKQDIPVHQQLLDIGKQYGELMTSEDFLKLSRIVLARFLQFPQESGGTMHRHASTEGAIALWMEQAKANGCLSIADPCQAAIELTALINAFAYWPRLIQEDKAMQQDELHKVIDNAVTIFLNHYQK